MSTIDKPIDPKTGCEEGYHRDSSKGECYKQEPSADGCNTCTYYQGSNFGSCTLRACTKINFGSD